jgi:peptide deformylase
MFAPTIHLECISFFEPAEGVWREENVKASTEDEAAARQEGDEEDFLAFCRRSLM